jgi:hypothetical protein
MLLKTIETDAVLHALRSCKSLRILPGTADYADRVQ